MQIEIAEAGSSKRLPTDGARVHIELRKTKTSRREQGKGTQQGRRAERNSNASWKSRRNHR